MTGKRTQVYRKFRKGGSPDARVANSECNKKEHDLGCDMETGAAGWLRVKRIKKAIMIPVRNVAYRWSLLKLYYWAEEELFELRSVQVMPTFYYKWLFNFSMRIVHIGRLRRFADKIIHSIPYHIRFNLA